MQWRQFILYLRPPAAILYALLCIISTLYLRYLTSRCAGTLHSIYGIPLDMWPTAAAGDGLLQGDEVVVVVVATTF